MKINHYFNGGVIVSDKNSIGKILEILPDDIYNQLWDAFHASENSIG